MLCEHCGQSWQAAVLEGWRLHHDPNFEATDASVKMPIEGNPRRDLWKKLAWMAAESKHLDEYTKATVGILCGHLKAAIVPLSNSWVDLLWAYLKVQIDIRVESEIRSCCIKNYIPLPDTYWNNKMTLEQIFDELSANKNPKVHADANTPVNIIQKYLILDDIPEMMKHMDSWLSTSTVDSQMLRFLTHVVLFMRQVGRHHQEDIADNVIKSYVDCLITMGETQLVAFYTAALPTDLQVELYSKFLLTVHETDARKVALEEGKGVGLDVHTITCYTVQAVRNEQPAVQVKPLEGQINDFDARKISILEWLTFNTEDRSELLWQTNAMIRIFLAESKIECVRSTLKMVPHDSIQQIVVQFGSKDNLPYREECSIKEYLCYQTYLGAIDGYNEWTRLYHKEPKEPQLASTHANFTERIASEHKQTAFAYELERWKANLREQTKGITTKNYSPYFFLSNSTIFIVTKELLYNVLLFPDKGFLVDGEMDKPLKAEEYELNWKHRQIQMENLRVICIPEVVLLLHQVLNLAGEYRECIRLSDELASEKRQLYKVYSKIKLAEIIAKISESSLALMNEKFDPWGYSIAN